MTEQTIFAALSDTLLEVSPRIHHVWSLTEGDDYYGDLMSFWFSLNDVCLMRGKATEPSYSPGACIVGILDLAWPASELSTVILSESNIVLSAVHAAFSLAYDQLHAIGANY